MLDIIIALKECLGLVLLTGAITGYLYTIFAARETYLPQVENLKQQIDTHTKERETLETEYHRMQEAHQQEKSQMPHLEEEIGQLRHNIASVQKTVTALKTANEETKQTYATTHALLSTQQERETALRKEIGDDSVTSLLQEEENQQERIHTLQKEINHERALLEETREKVARISTQKEEFESKRNNLHNALSELKEKLSEKSQLVETLDTTMQQKIASLKEEYNHWQKKIKTYKERLLSLKESR